MPGRATSDSIDLRFDTNLDQLHFAAPPAECVRDYSIEVRSGGPWREVASERGNYHRRRLHHIAPVRGDAVRVKVLATNGAPSARLYEVRVYPPGRR